PQPTVGSALEQSSQPVLPEASSAWNLLHGQNSFGDTALTGPNGAVKSGSNAAVGPMLNALLGALLPGASKLQGVLEGGKTPYGTSTLWNPQTKAGSKGSILDKLLNPFHAYEAAGSPTSAGKAAKPWWSTGTSGGSGKGWWNTGSSSSSGKGWWNGGASLRMPNDPTLREEYRTMTPKQLAAINRAAESERRALNPYGLNSVPWSRLGLTQQDSGNQNQPPIKTLPRVTTTRPGVTQYPQRWDSGARGKSEVSLSAPLSRQLDPANSWRDNIAYQDWMRRDPFGIAATQNPFAGRLGLGQMESGRGLNYSRPGKENLVPVKQPLRIDPRTQAPVRYRHKV